MINFLIKQRRRPLVTGDTDLNRLLPAQPAADSDESDYFDQEYKRQTFRWATQQIRGEFRESTWQAFWRTCVEGQGIKQVAAELNMSLGAVYVARSRVMARLRKKVEYVDEK